MVQKRNNNLPLVYVPVKSLDDYTSIVGEEKVQQLRQLAAPLKGKKLLHLNATAYGGGVAELLKTQVPLLRDLGLDVDWGVLEAPQEYYEVTKIFHNTLQGKRQEISDEQIQTYLDVVKNNAQKLEEEYDIILVHDPQPLSIIDFAVQNKAKWIWRCHIDTSEPNPGVWNFLYPYMTNYDAVIFTMDEFVKEDAQFGNLNYIPPSIDPLSPKNTPIHQEVVNKYMYNYNIDVSRPLMAQISRFDPWKDPLGVIDVYRNIKKDQVQKGIKGLQLALLASMAHDDPEGWSIYDRVLRKAGEDYDINILTNFHNIGDIEVKCFQSAADVILQKSLKEGFGLTVSEALWKGKPVIGGNVGGIKLQIKDGENGFLVSNIQEATEKSLYLLENPDNAKSMGDVGKETVRENFLSIREINDHLELFNKLVN